MAPKSVEVTIAKELVPYLYTIQAGETVQEKVTLSVVIGLFASKIITLEKAAELTGKSLWDFIDMLKACQIPWGEYTEEELQMDDIALKNLTGGFLC